jgi:hypothetical protein
LALANDFDATPCRIAGWLPVAELALWPALWPALLPPGLALEAWGPVPDVAAVAPGEPAELLVTWGVVPFGTEPLHPARPMPTSTVPTRTMPARVTAADPCLLM